MGSGLKKRSSLLSWNFRVSMSDKSAGSITFDAGNNPFTTRMVRLLVRRGTGRRVRGHTLWPNLHLCQVLRLQKDDQLTLLFKDYEYLCLFIPSSHPTWSVIPYILYSFWEGMWLWKLTSTVFYSRMKETWVKGCLHFRILSLYKIKIPHGTSPNRIGLHSVHKPTYCG